MADRTVTYQLRADIAQFRAQMAQASAAVKQTATEMTALDKGGIAARKGLTTLGSSAGKVGLLAAAGLGAAVLASAKFDFAMSSVAAATHESTQNMELLRAAALKAGADTVFSASEAAGAIEALAKAGVSTKDILGGGLSGALDLAAAGSMDVAAAAEAAATAMTQFGLQGGDVPHVADLLAAAAGKAQGEVADFSMALNQSGLVAAQMGLSIEETTGSLAAFASAGLIGSDAGTSLKTMLLRLANPSKEAAAAMKDFGISAYDAQGNMLPLADIAEQLKTGFEGQRQATRDAALATIFGSDAIRAANVLYNEGAQGIEDWTGAVNDQGYAAETAATKLDNLKGDVESLKGSLETLFIGIGDSKQGMFRSLVQGATDLTNALNKLPDGAESAVGSLLGLTAITGGGLWLGAKTVNAVSDLKQALEQMGPAGTKAAGALRGIGVAAAGLVALDAASEYVNELALSGDRAAPSVDRLTRNLENLGQGKSKWTALSIRGISEEVGNLGALLDDTDSQFAGTLQQTENWLGKIPLVGDEAVHQINLLDSATTRSLVGWREADATIQALDQALMQIASSAGPGGAQKAFNQLARSQGLSADQQAKLMALLPEFGALMRDTGRAGKDAGDGTNFFGDAAGRVIGLLPEVASGAHGVQQGFKDAAGAALTFKGALEELNGLLDKRDALRNYQSSIEDLADTVKEFGPDSREAAQGFDDLARNIGVVASHMKGAAKVEFLTQATRDLEAFGQKLKLPPKLMGPVIDSLYAAMAAADHASGAQADLIQQYHLTPKQVDTLIKQSNMGASQADIRDLLHQYGLTPKEIRTAVALIGAASAAAQLDDLARDRTASIFINTIGGGSGSDHGRATNEADGGTVPSTGLPYADRHPYMLADGEEVISNRHGQADRNRALLKAINAGRLADGGTTGSGTPSHWYRHGGLDMSSQLYGINKAFLSIRELGERLASLSNKQIRHLSDDFDHLGKRGVEKLSKAFDVATKQMQKDLDDQKTALGEARDALHQLKDAAKQFSDEVANNFEQNTLGYSTTMTLSDGTEVSNPFSIAHQIGTTLTNQASSAYHFLQLLKELKRLGLNGGLFNQIAASGDIALAQSFADLSKQEIRQYEQMYQSRQNAVGALGDYASTTRYGDQIKAQMAEVREQTREVKQIRQSLKQVEVQIKELNRTGPKRTGEAVGEKINRAAARAVQ